MSFVKYSPHLITYLDILGFREVIKHKSAGDISKMIRLVREAVAPDSEDKDELKKQFEHFSDLIIVTTPVYSPANVKLPIGLVFAELLHLAIAQMRLMSEGILVRGALTVGDLVKSYRVVYGPGLIQAYELEHNDAVFPRIVVDQVLMKQLRTNHALRFHDYRTEIKEIKNLIRKDSDGLYFVDYLRAISSELPNSDAYVEFLNTHQKLIQKALRELRDKRRIRRKYLWLRTYHNSIIRDLPKPFHRQLVV